MIYESEGQGWRAAYAQSVRESVLQLKQERAVQSKRRLYYGHKTYVVKDMTDAQIDVVSRIEAERACERAINELAWNEAILASKRARGEAA